MQRITRRRFLGGASALALGTQPWSGFASDPGPKQLLLIGSQVFRLIKSMRHLALDPTDRCLLVANQEADTIAVFARDSKTDKLANEGKTFPLSGPQCLVSV